MSVLIKGMKMPTEGKVMAIYKVKGKFFASLNGTELYPLIELSDHGDLIDREAWKKSLIDEGETIGIDGFSIDGLSADDVCYAIENAPAIIPEERRTNDEKQICAHAEKVKELVRCKDCKWWERDYQPRYHPDERPCNIVGMGTPPEWYCADGERREGEEG